MKSNLNKAEKMAFIPLVKDEKGIKQNFLFSNRKNN